MGIELHVNLSLYKVKTRINTTSIYQTTIVTLFSFNKSKILIIQIIYNTNSTNTYNSNIHRQEKEKDIITTSNTRTDMHVYINIIIEIWYISPIHHLSNSWHPCLLAPSPWSTQPNPLLIQIYVNERLLYIWLTT